LADWPDEPDRSPRARRALGTALRGRLNRTDTWLAAYGAFSLLAGVALLVILVTVFWIITRELVISLFTGSITDIIVGIYYVAPLTIGIILSALGLFLTGLRPSPTRRAFGRPALNRAG
jgi:putative peptide zinc metalloprotease protein